MVSNLIWEVYWCLPGVLGWVESALIPTTGTCGSPLILGSTCCKFGSEKTVPCLVDAVPLWCCKNAHKQTQKYNCQPSDEVLVTVMVANSSLRNSSKFWTGTWWEQNLGRNSAENGYNSGRTTGLTWRFTNLISADLQTTKIIFPGKKWQFWRADYGIMFQFFPFSNSAFPRYHSQSFRNSSSRNDNPVYSSTFLTERPKSISVAWKSRTVTIEILAVTMLFLNYFNHHSKKESLCMCCAVKLLLTYYSHMN